MVGPHRRALRSARLPLTLFAALAAACGDDGTTTPQPTPTIGVAASPATLTLTAGQSGTVTVNLTRGGNYTGAVALAVTGAPTGVTVTPNPASLTGSTTSSTVSVATAATTAAGNYTLTVTGSGSGVASQTATVALTVNAAPQTLTVVRAGSGTGTVTSSPAGITCGATCSASFASGAAVTLTAAPATGSTFAGWSGGGCSGTGTTCTVTLSAAASVTATFNTSAAPTHTLTVTRAGSGTGTVTSAPAGITCGTTCSASFAQGATVTLTAAAAAGSTFAGWSGGGCSGTGATCAVTMSAAQSVTATFNTAPAGSFTLALAPAAITVTAGGAAVTSTATIARASGFTGAVDLALTGAPAGLTVTAAPANVTGTTSTISATAAATVAPGSYPVTVTGTGTGVASQTATLTITVVGPQSFALAVTPASVSVQQGATGTATVNVTRAGGFTGAVALTATGAPAGLTVTPTPASATGATSTLTISAGATTAPGTYTITVGGTGTGVANQSATFSVVVTQAPTGGGGNVTYSFAGCDPTTIPIWLAVQNGTGAWTRVTANAAGAFSFTIGATGGVAYVTQAGTSYALTVFYGSGTELAGSGNRCGGPIPPRGTKRLTGSVANVGMTETANVSIGGSFATVIPFQNTAFTLDSVAAGERDLIATRSALTGTAFAVNKVIIRRATNYASTIPTLDFAAAEAFDPVQRTATLNNLGGEQAFASVAFITANTASAAFYAGTGTGSTIPFYGVPTAQLATGDYHMLSIGAIPSSTAAPTSFRNVITFLRAATDRTVTLGPALSAPTVTSLATTPYLRLRAQFASQAQYNGMASAVYSQAARTASVTATAAYFGGVPATWSLDIPDLSAAAFDPTWGLRTGVRTDWSVIGFGGDFLAFAGGTPTDGAQVFQAMQSGTSTAFVRLLRARGIALPSRRQ